MTVYNVKTFFEMSDGRGLSCEYVLCVIEGRNYGLPEDCEPSDDEASDPVYTVDGIEVAFDNLPKGLSAIAEKMFEASWGEFQYDRCLA